MKVLLLAIIILLSLANSCIHDHFAHDTEHHFYNDLDEGRRLE